VPSKAAEPKPLFERVAVIDIGSNSIRLVVYHDAGRAPLPVFNEKVMCSIGRGVEHTGKLSPEGVTLALATLVRYKSMTDAMGVSRLEVVATAAVRDARNGRDFVAQIERETGLSVRILSGSDEVELSAEGVVSAFPRADGFVGDLGGGSLELIDVRRGVAGDRITLPLGPLRLMDAADGNLRRGRHIVERAFKQIPWLGALRGRPFYAVGGSWRTMARLHMEATKYPLHIIHHYKIDAGKLRSLFKGSGPWSARAFDRRAQLSRRRVDLLPWAAMVMEALFDRAPPSRLVFSAWGLREGCLYARLPAKLKAHDPLFDAVRVIAGESRFGLKPGALFGFITPILMARQVDDMLTRLAHAVCTLSDFAWSEHPDYRAVQAYRRALLMPVVGTDHAGRAFLAVALGTRYGASLDALPDRIAVQLLPSDHVRTAQAVGLAVRLAYTLSGGAPDLLAGARLVASDQSLTLEVPAARRLLVGDTVMRRLEGLARNLGLAARLAPETKNAAA
jgi:exopolyphosphatase / guanosine-5'-triphosphate,3'-diphosphate pyrophosphatase